MTDAEHNYDQVHAIAHVFIDLISTHNLDEDVKPAGAKADLVMARLDELDAVTIQGNHVDLTPLLSGAAIALQSLLDAFQRTGLDKDDAVVAWRSELDR